jgi:DNA-binding winged helix-turn-helix (wHTH) protein/tetratricopeptide (TPR) repeat protein
VNAGTPSVPPSPPGLYRLDDLLIDTSLRRVTRESTELAVNNLTFDLLVALVQAAPGLLSFDVLMEQVWPGVVVSLDTVSQRVKLLRQALGDNADRPRYVLTVRGHGYRLVPPPVPVLRRPKHEAATSLGGATPPSLVETPIIGPDETSGVAAGAGSESVQSALAQPAQPRSFAGGPRFFIAVVSIAVLLGVSWWGLRHARSVGGNPTPDAEASQLYQQSRAVGHGTARSEKLALDLVDQAIARDPDFAPALAYRALLAASNVGMISAPAQALDGAWRDASRALAIDPNLQEALIASAIVAAVRGQWSDSERNFRAAIALSAGNPYAENFHVLFVLKPTGRLREARARLDASYRLAPADGFLLSELTLTSALQGVDRDTENYAQLWQEVADQPLKWDLLIAAALADTRAGRYAEATRKLEAALPTALGRQGGDDAVRAFGAALADPTLRPAALRSLDQLAPALQSADVDARTRGFVLTAMVMLGGVDAAYVLAGQLLSSRPETLWNADWSDLWLPEMQPFRQDPRFRELVQRLGFADYWRQYGPPDECMLRDASLVCH